MNEVLEVEPMNAKAFYLRGCGFYKLNDVMRAYQDFMQALDIDPSQSRAIMKYINQIQ